MRRDTSILCAHTNIVINHAITVSKCDFPVYHFGLAFHEAAFLEKLLKHSTNILLA